MRRHTMREMAGQMLAEQRANILLGRTGIADDASGARFGAIACISRLIWPTGAWRHEISADHRARGIVARFVDDAPSSSPRCKFSGRTTDADDMFDEAGAL